MVHLTIRRQCNWSSEHGPGFNWLTISQVFQIKISARVTVYILSVNIIPGLKELDVYFKSQRIFSEDLCYAAAKRKHIQRTIMARSYFHTLTVICGLKAKFARLMKTKYVVKVPIGAITRKAQTVKLTGRICQKISLVICA